MFVLSFLWLVQRNWVWFKIRNVSSILIRRGLSLTFCAKSEWLLKWIEMVEFKFCHLLLFLFGVFWMKWCELWWNGQNVIYNIIHVWVTYRHRLVLFVHTVLPLTTWWKEIKEELECMLSTALYLHQWYAIYCCSYGL